MLSNSDIAALKLSKQPYFHQKNDCCIYIKFGHHGLVIKIATIGMIQKNQVLQYCFADENVPRGLTIQGLFTYLKNHELLQVDIAKKTLKIKLINIQEDGLADHSITLDLICSSLSDDYFLIYYFKNEKAKGKSIVKPVLVFSFAVILCLIFLRLTAPKSSLGNVQHIKQQILAQAKASFEKVLKEQIKKALSPINMKIEQVIKEQMELKSKIKQAVQKIDLMTYEDKKHSGNRYKQEIQLLNSQYNNSKSRLQFEQVARSKTSLANIQSQIEEIKKAIKMLSVFDLTSKNIQSFNIDGNQATYKALSGRYTQLPLRSKIPFDQKLHYDFKIINSPHNSTFIGVVDGLRGKQHRSSIQFHSTIAYSARGQLWRDGQKKQQTGIGYNVGDIVRMEVELSKGFIRWMVNDKMVKEITSEKLQDNFIDYRPYVEMATKGDTIEIGRHWL